jgi:hypothetical protein
MPRGPSPPDADFSSNRREFAAFARRPRKHPRPLMKNTLGAH